MSEWRCCIKDPPEEAYKILCMKHGDFYVAQRFSDRYFPIPFIPHENVEDLSKPELWKEIDFPWGLTGKMKFIINGEAIGIEELKKNNLEIYTDLCRDMFSYAGIKYKNKIKT